MDSFKQPIEEVRQNISLIAAVSFVAWLAIKAVYRLYLSPLAKIPGPKIAALTLWYETYHDVWRRGQYVYKIKEMHEKYGEAPLHAANMMTLIPSQRPNCSNQSARSSYQ